MGLVVQQVLRPNTGACKLWVHRHAATTRLSRCGVCHKAASTCARLMSAAVMLETIVEAYACTPEARTTMAHAGRCPAGDVYPLKRSCRGNHCVQPAGPRRKKADTGLTWEHSSVRTPVRDDRMKFGQ